MSLFASLLWIGVIVTVVVCGTFRSRIYATFRGILLTLHTLIAIAVLPVMAADLHRLVERIKHGWRADFHDALPDSPLGLLTHGPGLVLLYLQVVVFVDAMLLVRPKPRPLWFRFLVSLPAHYFGASMLLALPWAIASLFGLPLYGVWFPFLVSVVGLFQSLTLRKEERVLRVGGVERVQGVTRLQSKPEGSPREEALRILQITDPHLGPFMSVTRLASICQRAVHAKPDLIFLTGDFLTMESQQNFAYLRDALAPLKAAEGKVYACLGNHDHEALDLVKRALKESGVHLLIDDSVDAVTRLGTIEILGFDFHFRNRAERTLSILKDKPRTVGKGRILLLHDPGAFKHLPDGAADLVLSGHTHGGQVGLVSMGLNFTLAHAVAKIPDHGLWGQGSNRLYVHRGTGHYGFPLRLGVPGEESILHVVWS